MNLALPCRDSFVLILLLSSTPAMGQVVVQVNPGGTDRALEFRPAPQPELGTTRLPFRTINGALQAHPDVSSLILELAPGVYREEVLVDPRGIKGDATPASSSTALRLDQLVIRSRGDGPVVIARPALTRSPPIPGFSFNVQSPSSGSPGPAHFALFNLHGLQSVRLEGIEIDTRLAEGTVFPSGAPTPMAVVAEGSNLEIVNCRLTGMEPLIGGSPTESDFGVISTVDVAGLGVLQPTLLVSGSRIQGFAGAAILSVAGIPTLLGNVILGPGEVNLPSGVRGISILQPTGLVQIRGNVIYDFARSGPTRSGAGCGIDVRVPTGATAFTLPRLVIADNVVERCQFGICIGGIPSFLSAIERNQLRNGSIAGSPGHGISISVTDYGCRGAASATPPTGCYPPSMPSITTITTVADNVITEFGDSGIYVEAGGVTFTRNRLQNNATLTGSGLEAVDHGDGSNQWNQTTVPLRVLMAGSFNIPGAGGESDPTPSGIRDVYVSTSGSDLTGTGGSADPFASIQRALDAVDGLGTIHVGSGVFRGAITYDPLGTSGLLTCASAPCTAGPLADGITIRGAGVGQTIIRQDLAPRMTGSSPVDAIVSAHDAPGLRLAHLTIDGEGGNGLNSNCAGAIFSGVHASNTDLVMESVQVMGVNQSGTRGVPSCAATAESVRTSGSARTTIATSRIIESGEIGVATNTSELVLIRNTFDSPLARHAVSGTPGRASLIANRFLGSSSPALPTQIAVDLDVRTAPSDVEMSLNVIAGWGTGTRISGRPGGTGLRISRETVRNCAVGWDLSGPTRPNQTTVLARNLFEASPAASKALVIAGDPCFVVGETYQVNQPVTDDSVGSNYRSCLFPDFTSNPGWPFIYRIEDGAGQFQAGREDRTPEASALTLGTISRFVLNSGFPIVIDIQGARPGAQVFTAISLDPRNDRANPSFGLGFWDGLHIAIPELFSQGGLALAGDPIFGGFTDASGRLSFSLLLDGTPASLGGLNIYLKTAVIDPSGVPEFSTIARYPPYPF